MRRLRYKTRTMRTLALLILIILLPACAAIPRAQPPVASGTDARRETLFVINHGWHTGIVVSSDAVHAVIPDLQEHFPASPFYEFGWGEREFYQAEAVDSGTALSAALWPSPAVVYVAPVGKPRPEFSADRVVEVNRSSSELQSLVAYLQRSFTQTSRGKLVLTGYRTAHGGRFFEGEGRYSLFNTCNTWTAKALRSAGLPIDFASVITAGDLMQWLAAQAPDE